jgi:hypothetical protein
MGLFEELPPDISVRELPKHAGKYKVSQNDVDT